MQKKEYTQDQMILFAQFCEQSKGNPDYKRLFFQWQIERPAEAGLNPAPLQAVTHIGRTVGDILGLKGPSQEKPSGN